MNRLATFRCPFGIAGQIIHLLFAAGVATPKKTYRKSLAPNRTSNNQLPPFKDHKQPNWETKASHAVNHRPAVGNLLSTSLVAIKTGDRTSDRHPSLL